MIRVLSPSVVLVDGQWLYARTTRGWVPWVLIDRVTGRWYLLVEVDGL